jgi:uncharacterized protein (DUF2147 family)
MAAVLVAMAAAGAAGAAGAQDAGGLWKTETNDRGAYLHVRVGPCADDGAKLCGIIEEAVNATRTDLPGKAIIRNMQPNGAGKWNRGTIWAPDDDKTYRSNMALQGDALRVEGCVAVFCRGQTWTRVE